MLSFRSLALITALLILAALANADDDIPAHRLHRLPPGMGLAPAATRTPPPGAEVVSPAEFCRAEAMILSWVDWHATELLDMTYEIALTDKVICAVASEAKRREVLGLMEQRGVDMDNVELLVEPLGTVWVRDYGPFTIYEDGLRAITDMVYGTGGQVDAFSCALADHVGIPCYESNLSHHGGNHLVDGNGMGFFSTNLTAWNSHWSESLIRQELRDYFGVQDYVVFGTMEGDGTGHCDMFVKLLNDTLFVVGEYSDPDQAMGDDAAFLDDLARTLDDLKNLDGRDFEVRRLPMNPRVGVGTNRTYTNSLILNGTVLVPTYGTELDAAALAIYADCMPRHRVVGIDASDLINYLGAVHCVTNTLHAADPLTLLHAPLLTAVPGSRPQIDCRLNPRFQQREVAVHVEAQDGTVQVVPAAFSGGVWRASLPAVDGDFTYWIQARAFSGGEELKTSTPDLFVDTDDSTAIAGSPDLVALTCHPNPCNPRTTFRFSWNGAGSGELALHDLAGLRVRSWDVESGRDVRWEGGDHAGRQVPSGVYLARLTVAGRSTNLRVVLVR